MAEKVIKKAAQRDTSNSNTLKIVSSLIEDVDLKRGVRRIRYAAYPLYSQI